MPYGGLVPNDPTYEQMKHVVVTQKKRPQIPFHWRNHKVKSQFTYSHLIIVIIHLGWLSIILLMVSQRYLKQSWAHHLPFYFYHLQQVL